MDEIKYIDDPRGGRVPLTDAYGNLTLDAMFLYNKGLLSTESKALMDEILADDEMARDALEGYAIMTSEKKAKADIANINGALGSEKEVVVTPVFKLDHKKLLAAAAILILVGIGGYIGVNLTSNNQLAERTTETKRIEPTKQAETVKRLKEIDLRDTNAQQGIGNVESTIENGMNQQFEEDLNAITESEMTEQPVLANQKIKKEDRTEVGASKPEEQNPASKSNPREELLAKLASLREKKNELSQDSNKSGQEVKSGMATTQILHETEDEPASVSAQQPKAVLPEIASTDEASASDRMTLESGTEERLQMQKRAQREPVSEAEYMGDADALMDSEPIDKTVYNINQVDLLPRFPGGDLEFFKFIEKQKIHPPLLKDQGIEGEVFVSFQLDANGNVTNVKPLRSDDPQMESDALRVVRSMPQWQAAKKGGYPVAVKKTILIKYKIKE